MAETKLNTVTNSGAQAPADFGTQATSQLNAAQPAGQWTGSGTPISSVQPANPGTLSNNQPGIVLGNLPSTAAQTSTGQASQPAAALTSRHIQPALIAFPTTLLLVAVVSGWLIMRSTRTVKTTTYY